MMGTKARRCVPLPKDISLEDLVPEDHFCHLQCKYELPDSTWTPWKASPWIANILEFRLLPNLVAYFVS